MATTNIYFKVGYTGLDTLKNVKETYSLGMSTTSSDEISYEYNYENNVGFTDDVSIESLNEDNSVMLNDEDSDFIEQLIEAITQRIEQINEEQMEQLETDTNPILYTNPYTMMFVQFANAFSGASNTLNEDQVKSFNSKFEKYEGMQTGATVKNLYKEVEDNNADDEMRLIDIEGNATDIDSSLNYKVTINYDDDGYVNEILVEEAN